MTDTEAAERRAAYRRLEEAIQEVGHLEGAEGVFTEWVVAYSTQIVDDDGDACAQVGTLTPGGGGQTPYHRMMGLLDYAHTRMRAEVADVERS